MHHQSRTAWKKNDYTAEDLIFAKYTEYKRGINEEDQVNLPNYRWPMQPVCSRFTALDANDYTGSGTTMAEICTYYIGQATMTVAVENATEPYILPRQIDENDQSQGESIRLEVKFEEGNNEESMLIQEIQELYKEHSENNWDGYGAERISPGAFIEAKRVAEMLPQDLPEPDVIPEPNGDIAFEWYRSKRKVFIISVDGSSVINYAGLYGRVSRVHGSEYFTDEIPANILEKIYNLFK